MSLAQYFLYEDSVKDLLFNNGHCALTSLIDDQLIMAARIPLAGSCLAGPDLPAGTGQRLPADHRRIVALVHVADPNAREQNLGWVKAEQMASSLDADGSVALFRHRKNRHQGGCRIRMLREIADVL